MMPAMADETPSAITQSSNNQPKQLKPFAWKPGQSGNPGGKLKGVTELRRRLIKLEPRARKRLMELIGSADEEIAFKALALFYAYTMGKPPENVDLMKMDAVRDRMRSVMAEVVRHEQLPSTPEPPPTQPPPVEEVAPSREAVPLAPTLTSSAPPGAPREVRVSGEPSGLRCLYRGKDGQCQELAVEGASWCLPHKTKLFSMVNE